MTKPDRPSVFDGEDLDLAKFQTKPATSTGAQQSPPGPDLVRQVANAGGFPSRAPAPLPRQPRTYRTGRSATFATKTTPETLETFYAIAEKRGWKVGETFEKAVELLAKAQE